MKQLAALFIFIAVGLMASGCGLADDVYSPTEVEFREVELFKYEVCADGSKTRLNAGKADKKNKKRPEDVPEDMDEVEEENYCWIESSYIEGPWDREEFTTRRRAIRFVDDMELEYEELPNVVLDVHVRDRE